LKDQLKQAQKREEKLREENLKLEKTSSVASGGLK